MCLFLFSSHMRRRYPYFAYVGSRLWWLGLRWNGFCLFLAQVLRSWSYATLAFVQAEPPRRPWQVLAGRRLVDCSWNRTAYMSSCGLISGVVKGQQEKRTLYQEMEKSPMRVQFQGSAVWGCGEQCESWKELSHAFWSVGVPSSSDAGPTISHAATTTDKSRRNTGVFFPLHPRERSLLCTLFWGVRRR